jgi:hypothetical protein
MPMNSTLTKDAPRLIHTVRQCVKGRLRTLPIALKANIG